MVFEAIIFYLFFLDAVIANVLAWFFPNWHKKKNKIKKEYRWFYKHFPTTRGWAIIYLVLVLWIGCALTRLGVIL